MTDTEVRKILVVRAGGLGDFILTLPSIKALREGFPKAYVEIMGYPSVLQLVEGRYYADKVSSIDQSGMARLFVKGCQLPDELIDYFSSFDLIVWYGYDRDGALSHNLGRTGAGRVFPVDPFPVEESRKHAVDHLLDALGPLGIEAEDRVPRLFLTEPARKFASEFWRLNLGGRRAVIAVHPGSGGMKKTWPPDRFVQVAQRAAAQYGAKILLISGPADGDLVDRMKNQIEGVNPTVLSGFPLVQLAAILERCSCFVGNDSGVTHISAAVAAPTIAVFGPTDPDIWGPRGERVVIVRSEIHCSPCTREELANCRHRRCLDLISVDDVLEEMKRLAIGDW